MQLKKITFLRSTYRGLKKVGISFLQLLTGHPRHFYRHTFDALAAIPGIQYTEIHPSYTLHRTNPNTVHLQIDSRFKTGDLGSSFTTPATFIACIPNGRVVGASGTIILPDNKMAADLSIEVGATPDQAENHYLFTIGTLPPITKTLETVAVLAAAWGSAYFHWIFDLLPRYALLQAAMLDDKVDKFVIPKLSSDFQRETLQMLGISSDRLIECNSSFHLQARQLVVPSLPGITGSMTKETCDFLRSLCLKEIPALPPSLRLYISRAKAPCRKAINEVAVETFLQQHGFETVYLEDYSFREQVQLMSRASIIVAPHGGGLTNLVFCPPGCKVVEIFSPDYVNPCYRALCNLVGLEYWYLLGKGAVPDVSKKNYVQSTSENMEVDMALLKATFERAGIK